MARKEETLTPLERGLQHLQVNDPRAAATALQEAVVSDPKDVEAHVWLADAFMRLSMLDEALAELVRAAELDHENADIRYKLGIAYYYRGMQKEWQQQLQAALAINPNHLAAQQALQTPHTMPFIVPEVEGVIPPPPQDVPPTQPKRPWQYVRYELRGYMFPDGRWAPINTVSSRRCDNCFHREGVRPDKLEVRTATQGETAAFLIGGLIGALIWRSTMQKKVPVSYTPMVCDVCRRSRIILGIWAAVAFVLGFAAMIGAVAGAESSLSTSSAEGAWILTGVGALLIGLGVAIYFLVRHERQKGMVIAKHTEYDVVFAFRNHDYAINFCRINGIPPATMSQKRAKKLGIL